MNPVKCYLCGQVLPIIVDEPDEIADSAFDSARCAVLCRACFRDIHDAGDPGCLGGDDEQEAFDAQDVQDDMERATVPRKSLVSFEVDE